MVKGQQPKKSEEVNEKEANHPAHPMDRTAHWFSQGGWFTLAGSEHMILLMIT
jgi:hypothetical protein